MGFIKLEDKVFESFIDEALISEKVQRISNSIYKDFGDEKIIFLSVLNGAFMFTSDLVKTYKGKCCVSFVKISSYNGIKSTGNIKNLIGLEENINGESIVIVEDIVDTGKTLFEITKTLKKEKPKIIKTCSLFFKPKSYQESIPLDYVGMEIPNDFIVGYGLDYNGLGRNLSHIYKLKKL